MVSNALDNTNHDNIWQYDFTQSHETKIVASLVEHF